MTKDCNLRAAETKKARTVSRIHAAFKDLGHTASQSQVLSHIQSCGLKSSLRTISRNWARAKETYLAPPEEPVKEPVKEPARETKVVEVQEIADRLDHIGGPLSPTEEGLLSSLGFVREETRFTFIFSNTVIKSCWRYPEADCYVVRSHRKRWLFFPFTMVTPTWYNILWSDDFTKKTYVTDKPWRHPLAIKGLVEEIEQMKSNCLPVRFSDLELTEEEKTCIRQRAMQKNR